jgi:hypothetical protein
VSKREELRSVRLKFKDFVACLPEPLIKAGFSFLFSSSSLQFHEWALPKFKPNKRVLGGLAKNILLQYIGIGNFMDIIRIIINANFASSYTYAARYLKLLKASEDVDCLCPRSGKKPRSYNLQCLDCRAVLFKQHHGFMLVEGDKRQDERV